MNVRLVFSRAYDLSLFGLERLHPFDARKYGRAWEIVRAQLGDKLDRLALTPSEPVSDNVLLEVHTRGYLADLRSSAKVARALELWPARFVPNALLQSRLLRPMRFATQGTILATKAVLREGGTAMNFGGGYHHAFRDHGEGFCIYADVALAIATQRVAGRLRPEDTVAVVDLDAHRGNGFAAVVSQDQSVRVFACTTSKSTRGFSPTGSRLGSLS